MRARSKQKHFFITKKSIYLCSQAPNDNKVKENSVIAVLYDHLLAKDMARLIRYQPHHYVRCIII